MRIELVMAGVAVIAATAPAAAQDRLGATQIATGNLTAAEASLNAERAIFPKRPEVLLNLAMIYAKTGRLEAARIYYDRVLALDAVAMDLATGEIASSHLIAERGLARLTTTIAAR